MAAGSARVTSSCARGNCAHVQRKGSILDYPVGGSGAVCDALVKVC